MQFTAKTISLNGKFRVMIGIRKLLPSIFRICFANDNNSNEGNLQYFYTETYLFFKFLLNKIFINDENRRQLYLQCKTYWERILHSQQNILFIY